MNNTTGTITTDRGKSAESAGALSAIIECVETWLFMVRCIPGLLKFVGVVKVSTFEGPSEADTVVIGVDTVFMVEVGVISVVVNVKSEVEKISDVQYTFLSFLFILKWMLTNLDLVAYRLRYYFINF